MTENVLALATNVRLLLMDVDGVLTDGKLYHLPDGAGGVWETKGFDSRDGNGLRWLTWYGIRTGVISGRLSPATVERAQQLSMSYVYQGHIEKLPILEEIVADAQIDPSQVAYVGDDLTDAVIMKRVGLGIAVANARPEVKRIANWTTSANGGEGAIREVVELLLVAQGKWPEILRKYEVG
jgi:3-deoxy-D-manno-octulosonate 8-phosphate phosphatase (KDO 8-P phosphatase)